MTDEPELNDATLIERAQAGDTLAYEALMRRHRSAAYRVALSIMRDSDDAEDATQDACIKAYYALASFSSGAPFRPWLMQIAANEARNRLRSKQRRARTAQRAGLDRGHSTGHHVDPELV